MLSLKDMVKDKSVCLLINMNAKGDARPIVAELCEDAN